VVDEVASTNSSCSSSGSGSSNPSTQQVNPAMSVSVTAVHDGVFRRPLLAPSQFKPLSKPGTADAFKAELDVSVKEICLIF
jgi:hypothetical protein